jgi:hypothetical protein
VCFFCVSVFVVSAPGYNVFRKYILHTSSEPVNKQANSSCRLLISGFLLGLLFDNEGEGNMIFRNVGLFIPRYTAPHPRRQYISESSLW